MPDLQFDVAAPDAVTIDLLRASPATFDETGALRSAVIVALCTDRRALDDDMLPHADSDDRRGWWADAGAAEIWNGWPIGSRLWLLDRESITGDGARRGSLLARIETYIREATQPFIDAGIASRVDVEAWRDGASRVGAVVTLYRGPAPAIRLQFDQLWTGIA